MKKILALACAMLFGACTIQVHVPPQGGVKDVPNIGEQVLINSVGSVWVKAKNLPAKLSGSAFAINKDHLLTAAHVCVAVVEYQDMGILEDKIYMTVLGKNNELTVIDDIEIAEIDEPHDICLLKRNRHGLTPLKFVSDYETNVKFGTKVWVIGGPAGVMLDSQEGRVRNPNAVDERIPLKNKLFVSGAATGGNSGGPVVNERGEIVGILVMGHSTYDHLSICVRAPVVQRFLYLVDMLN